MQVKTNVQAGGVTGVNHNEAQVPGPKVQTDVKAGGVGLNHNEAQVRPAGLKVQTGVKAGAGTIKIPPPPELEPGG